MKQMQDFALQYTINKLFKVFLLQCQTSIHWYRDFGLQTTSYPLICPVPSVVALKDPYYARFWCLERTFSDSVAASLDIFLHATEQQHVHFLWLGRKWNGYPSSSVCITIHAHYMLSVSEMRKPYMLTWRASLQCHLSLSAHAFRCNYNSSRCPLPPKQVCTRHSGIPCIVLSQFNWTI